MSKIKSYPNPLAKGKWTTNGYLTQRADPIHWVASNNYFLTISK